MTNAAPEQHLQCMEVWGGNQVVDSGVVMAGLDAWVYSKPFGDAAGGGDVHYVSSCATGRINRLLVADVSGHGEHVSGIAVKLRSLMRRYVNFIDQTRFVRALNREFVAMAQGGRFATAVVATFFGPTHELSLCNAGHPAPLLYRRKTGRWSALHDPRNDDNLNNMPLGILDVTQYEQFTLPLEVGDLVLCYTDSLTESRRPDGELLGVEGLLEVATGLSVDDPATMIPSLLAAIAALHPGNLSEDDVTVLLYRPNGLGARPPFLTRALAPIRVLCAAVASWIRPATGPAPWPEISWANLMGTSRPRKDSTLDRAAGSAKR